jgi:hypothetical protein
MIETITTAVIYCDGEGCDRGYLDQVEVSEESLLKFAIRDGWAETAIGRHLCPDCKTESLLTSAN